MLVLNKELEDIINEIKKEDIQTLSPKLMSEYLRFLQDTPIWDEIIDDDYIDGYK